jgi:hypothetical protein
VLPTDISLAVLGFSLAGVLLSLLIFWLLIFTAVRAALRSHQNAIEERRLEAEHFRRARGV